MISILVMPLKTGTLEDIPKGIPHIDIDTTHLVTHQLDSSSKSDDDSDTLNY